MNQKLLKLQLVMSGILCLGLLAEWIFGPDINTQKPLAASPDKASEESLLVLPTLSKTQKNPNDFREVVERPLFIEGRRPIVETQQDTAQQAELGQVDDWLLSGIFVKDKQAVALFTKKSEAKKYARLKVGQLLAGVLISEIQADRVILKIAGQTKVVLLRKPRADAPSQPKSVARLGQPQIPPVPQPGRPGKPMTPPSNINPENANDDSQKN